MTTPYGDLVETITTARFTPVRLREGYDMGEVDDLLDRIVSALGKAESVAELIDDARFTPVRLREGYDMGEVDQLLALVRRSAGSAPVPTPRDLDAPPPSVIQEQRGLLRRLLGDR